MRHIAADRIRMMPRARVAVRLVVAAGNAVSVALCGLAVGYTSAAFTVFTMICFLGVVGMLSPFIRLRLPRAWRRVRSTELRLYPALGAERFGHWLRTSPARRLNLDVYLDPGRDRSVVAGSMEHGEVAHIWANVVTLPYLALALIKGRWAGLGCIVAFNVVMNVYPILHLRLARHRLERVLTRLERRKQDAPTTLNTAAIR